MCVDDYCSLTLQDNFNLFVCNTGENHEILNAAYAFVNQIVQYFAVVNQIVAV